MSPIKGFLLGNAIAGPLILVVAAVSANGYAAVLGAIISLLAFTGLFVLRRRPPLAERFSIDDEVIAPGHPLYDVLMGTMEHGASSFSTVEGPDGIEVKNVRYEDRDR